MISDGPIDIDFAFVDFRLDVVDLALTDWLIGERQGVCLLTGKTTRLAA